jgi:hypothetical protein
MTRPRVTLALLEGELAVCRLAPDAPIPDIAADAELVSFTRTRTELSIVCPVEAAPRGATVERGWRALGVAGPLDFALTGILASLTDPLAAAGVSIFAIATYDTDYVLVRADQLDAAIEALCAAGHEVRTA